MKYLVLLVGYGEMPNWEDLTPAEQEAGMKKHHDFSAACAAADDVEILGGEALNTPDTMTSVRTRGGEMLLTGGPYAEAIEGLGGFYLIEAPHLDRLLELLKVLPAYDLQICPVIDVE